MPNWYVNCADNQAENKGPEIQVNVGALFKRWWLNCCSSGHATIRWAIEAGAENVDFTEYRSTQRVEFNPATTDEDIEAAFSRRLALSQVGGDRFTVRVYKGTDANPSLTIADIITRRLYRYSIETASTASEATYQRIRARLLTGFDAAFIDLEEAAAATSQHPGVITKVSPWLNQAKRRKAADAGVHIVFVDFLGGNPQARLDQFPDVTASGAWAFADERWTWTLQLGERESWHVDADKGHPPAVTINDVPLAPEAFTWTKVGDRGARLTITAPLSNLALTGHQGVGITYRLVTKIGGTSFIDVSCVVVTQDMPFPFAANQDHVDSAALVVILHELGHLLGLAVYAEKQRDGEWRETNDRWYTNDRGGQGTHCSHNAVLRANGHADALHYKVVSGTADGTHVFTPQIPAQPLCIMYHARTEVTYQIPGFCDRCIGILRRRNLTPTGENCFTKKRPAVLF